MKHHHNTGIEDMTNGVPYHRACEQSEIFATWNVAGIYGLGEWISAGASL